MDFLNAFYILLVGWLFGLLGPSILGLIKNEYRRREIKSGIFAELEGVKFLMANIVCFTSMRFGTYDKDLIKWLLPIYTSYRGETSTENSINLLNKQLKMDDAHFLLFAEGLKAEPEGGLSVKKYEIPYLNSKIGESSLFNNDFQRLSLDILSHIHLYNEEVEEARFYFKLTYQPDVIDENYERAADGAEASYLHLSE